MNYCRIRCVVSRIILLTHPIEALCLMIINYIMLFLEFSMKLVITFNLQSTKMKNKTFIWKISITFKLQGRFPPQVGSPDSVPKPQENPMSMGTFTCVSSFSFSFLHGNVATNKNRRISPYIMRWGSSPGGDPSKVHIQIKRELFR